MRIGYGPNPADRFHGRIDDARVYSRALSDEEAAILAVPETGTEIAAIPQAARTPAQRQKLRWAFLERAAPAELGGLVEAIARPVANSGKGFVASLPTVMVMDERPEIRPTHILFRRDVRRPPRTGPPRPAGRRFRPSRRGNRTTGWD